MKCMCVSMTVVVALLGGFVPATNSAWADGGKDGRRADRYAVRGPIPSGTNEFEGQSVEPPSISLSGLLQAQGVETSDDVGRFLNSLFPPSYALLSGGGIVVSEAEFATQYTIPSNRPGRAFLVPDSEATIEDGPITEVVEFSGWAADYSLTGSFFMAGRELIVNINWTQDDGTIVLVESFARTIHSAPTDDASVASGDGPVDASVGDDGYLKCKCSDSRGACSDAQCTRAARCWTGGTISCSWTSAAQ